MNTTKQFLLTLVLCLSASFSFAQNNNSNAIKLEDYGVVFNSLTHDNSAALQKAIDTAAELGATIYVGPGYLNYSQTLNIKAGVTLIGSGRGTNPNTTPYNGTILWYTGSGAAVAITGANVTVSNLTVYNKTAMATDGILLQSNNNLVESCTLSNVLIYGFVNGTALHFDAKNHSGVTYSSFYDVRIRHAKIGIEITPDSTSFINSNSFYHGVISGGGFDYCLKVEGGNNNIFYGTVMEPYTSTFGHIQINKGQIIGDHIRIEAIKLPKTLPVIYLGKKTADCQINGMYSGGLITNEGQNNTIELTH
jgi:hypothetical protein